MGGSATNEALPTGRHIKAVLVKRRHANVEYRAVVAFDDGEHLVVRGTWSEESPRDLGFVRFEPGDVFTEHYWRSRWYSIKEVRAEAGKLKGWYCDVARPVRVSQALVVSEDLDLDLWVSADGQTIIRLDEDDFALGGLAESDPRAADEARRALDELERLAGDRFTEVLQDRTRGR